MKKLIIFFVLMQFGCVANKKITAKIVNPIVINNKFNNINIVFAQRAGQVYKDYIAFPRSSSFQALFPDSESKRIYRKFIPVSWDVAKSLFKENAFIDVKIDQRFIMDTTYDAIIAYSGNRRPITSQWITSKWIHKTALNIQKSKPYQLDSVLARTGYLNAGEDDLLFYVFHDVRNPSVGGRPSGNFASFGEQAVRARSYVFGVLNKQVVYYKDNFYKAGDIRKLDSAQVAKITYSLFEDFFKAVKK